MIDVSSVWEATGMLCLYCDPPSELYSDGKSAPQCPVCLRVYNESNGIRLLKEAERAEYPTATHMLSCGSQWLPIRFVTIEARRNDHMATKLE
jgi:hypothetical protein